MRNPWRVVFHFSAAASLLLLIAVVLMIIFGSAGSEVFPSWDRELRWDPNGVGFLVVQWFNFHIHVLTNANVSTIHINLWILLTLFSVMPIAWICTRRQWRQQRPPSNACKHCGYDLTGNSHGTCPECGTHAGIRWRIIAQFHVEEMKEDQTRNRD